MSRVMDRLIQLKKAYASYGEYDGVYAKDVQEMIDELLADLHEDGKDDPDWCEWTLIDAEFNAYDTSCRNPWYLEAGTPEDNKMIYCPACGRKIKVVKGKKLREDLTWDI